jgi:hypothetical protein
LGHQGLESLSAIAGHNYSAKAAKAGNYTDRAAAAPKVKKANKSLLPIHKQL